MKNKRIVIGVKGDHDPLPHMKKIIRKTSYGMEIDLYDVPEGMEISESIHEVYRIDTKDIRPCLCRDDVSTILDLMEKERFWECHEYMEGKWKKLHGQKKEILHMIIRIIVSQVKWQMGQHDLSIRITQETMEKLRSLIDVRPDTLMVQDFYPIIPSHELRKLLDQIYID